MTGLPTGTVTLHDIEGSTRLLEQLSDVLPEVLRSADGLSARPCRNEAARRLIKKGCGLFPGTTTNS
jgi:hypothetical protein